MSTLYRAIFVILVFATIMGFTVNMNADTVSTNKVKDAVEIASHDALLQYDPVYFSRGEIRFSKNRAEDAFRKSLMGNLDVSRQGSSTLRPKEGSFFFQSGEDITIEKLVFIDNSTKPSQVSGGKLYSVDGSPVETYEDGTVKFPLLYVDSDFKMSSGQTTYRLTDGSQIEVNESRGVILERPGVVSVLKTQSPRWFAGKPTTIIQASAYNFKLSVPSGD